MSDDKKTVSLNKRREKKRGSKLSIQEYSRILMRTKIKRMLENDVEEPVSLASGDPNKLFDDEEKT
jgi:hypothetical protein